jgi:hypothetical protein
MATLHDAISTAANGALRVPIRSPRLRRRAHAAQVPASATITTLRHVQARWLGTGADMASRLVLDRNVTGKETRQSRLRT